jgi:hypothetical protein
MKRRPTTQDITWFLDLDRNKQLDLDPPYQRRSVWTRKDKQFFLNTIFRDFPSLAIFLHKSISCDGHVVHHVVDGKQRLPTILEFALAEPSQTDGSPAQALSNQCTGWCCIDRLSWQRLPGAMKLFASSAQSKGGD